MSNSYYEWLSFMKISYITYIKCQKFIKKILYLWFFGIWHPDRYTDKIFLIYPTIYRKNRFGHLKRYIKPFANVRISAILFCTILKKKDVSAKSSFIFYSVYLTIAEIRRPY